MCMEAQTTWSLVNESKFAQSNLLPQRFNFALNCLGMLLFLRNKMVLCKSASLVEIVQNVRNKSFIYIVKNVLASRQQTRVKISCSHNGYYIVIKKILASFTTLFSINFCLHNSLSYQC